MIMVHLIVQLHHGHELDAYVPWPGTEVPSPRELAAQVMEGDLEGFRLGAEGMAPSRITWDPHEAVSTVTELSTLEVPDGVVTREGIVCQECGTPAVMGLECGECGTLVSGEPPR